MKLTKQGVRDLGGNSGHRRYSVLPTNCSHPRMRQCHERCGHWVCPDCGENYDQAADEDPDYLYRRLENCNTAFGPKETT